MGTTYTAIGWSRQKRLYDGVIVGAIGLYLAIFLGVSFGRNPSATVETALIRGFGSAAIFALHVVLAIGPLCRLDRRFLPLLYNRRHLGVATFLLGLAHGGLAWFQFHALGDRNPFLSLLTSNLRFDSVREFPFQLLGAAALVILFLMAATSHDFWLANLSPRVWKSLHMAVYLAYALLVMHVALGALQSERSPFGSGLLGLGLVILLGLHVAAAWRERRVDQPLMSTGDSDLAGWVEVGSVQEIPELRAKVVTLGTGTKAERVAVFRYDGKISAIGNVCRHQGGPLGEGKILDGCVTCPWHGFQYLPESGTAPPPFHEKVETYAVAVRAGRVWIDPRCKEAGTWIEPAQIDPRGSEAVDKEAGTTNALGDEFFVGWQERQPSGLGLRSRWVALGLIGLVVGVSLVVSLSQQPFAAVTFEYGRPREFSGRLQVTPLPMLWVLPPNRDPQVASAGYALVAVGKHGADSALVGWHDRSVTLRGTLIRRGGRAMIEVVPDSLVAAQVQAPRLPRVERLGVRTVEGVIADGKCFLGVMNPGEGKVHRDCAVRCLSGGVPALLLAADPVAQERWIWLAAPDGGSLGREALDRVAELVRVRGEMVRIDDQLFLETEPDGIERVRPRKR